MASAWRALVATLRRRFQPLMLALALLAAGALTAAHIVRDGAVPSLTSRPVLSKQESHP